MGGAVVLVMGPSSPQGPIRHVGYAVPRQISCRGRAPSGRSQIESEGGPAARWKPRRATVPDVFARSTEGARPRLIVVLLFLALLDGILPSASARAADPLSSRIAAARDRQASLRDSMARQERLIADLDATRRTSAPRSSPPTSSWTASVMTCVPCAATSSAPPRLSSVSDGVARLSGRSCDSSTPSWRCSTWRSARVRRTSKRVARRSVAGSPTRSGPSRRASCSRSSRADRSPMS